MALQQEVLIYYLRHQSVPTAVEWLELGTVSFVHKLYLILATAVVPARAARSGHALVSPYRMSPFSCTHVFFYNNNKVCQLYEAACLKLAEARLSDEHISLWAFEKLQVMAPPADHLMFDYRPQVYVPHLRRLIDETVEDWTANYRILPSRESDGLAPGVT
ncbi:hypothetical protein JCGZ_02427 [Jatropha curcas]|uniref:Uncharacterized protein n=1 Tax=Jatropha curcas TaxID=180498 RepID=A0A067LET2_JATCU|nr:hypothetical protein JCGZ_02427 [Jatropha curcas]